MARCRVGWRPHHHRHCAHHEPGHVRYGPLRRARQGRRLTNLDVHDIICKIGECVVAGGVRRSAMISLSDLDDDQMRDAKKGAFWQMEGQRSMANNSAVYETKPSATFSESRVSGDCGIPLTASAPAARGAITRSFGQ